MALSVVRAEPGKEETELTGSGLDLEKRIVQSLTERPSSSISEVARWLNINRSTASKYLHVLQAKGVVGCRQVGPVKLWSIGGGVEV